LFPLIYELVLSATAQQPAIAINLIFYDVSGEDFVEPSSIVRFARFIFNASALIFLVDPVNVPSLFKLFPPTLQDELLPFVQVQKPAVDMVDRILALVERYHRYQEGDLISEPLIAIMLSKADLLQYDNILKKLQVTDKFRYRKKPHYGTVLDLNDRALVDQEAKALLKQYEQGEILVTIDRYQQKSFFATSATGDKPDANGKFKYVQPHRCLDPLLWILYCKGFIKASNDTIISSSPSL